MFRFGVRGDREARDDTLLAHDLALQVELFHEALTAHLGITVTERKVLDVLGRFPGSEPSPTDIRRATQLSPAAVTKVVDKLVARGYAERVAHETDGRSVRIRVTEHYTSRAAPSVTGVTDQIAAINRGLSARDRAAVDRWVRTVTEVLRVATAELTG